MGAAIFEPKVFQASGSGAELWLDLLLRVDMLLEVDVTGRWLGDFRGRLTAGCS